MKTMRFEVDVSLLREVAGAGADGLDLVGNRTIAERNAADRLCARGAVSARKRWADPDDEGRMLYKFEGLTITKDGTWWLKLLDELHHAATMFCDHVVRSLAQHKGTPADIEMRVCQENDMHLAVMTACACGLKDPMREV